MKLKLVSVLVTLAFVFTMILSGCGNSGTSQTLPEVKTSDTSDETTQAAAPAENPSSIYVMSQRVEDKAYYDDITTAFMKEYPNITVKLDLVPTAQYDATATARVAADQVDVLVTPVSMKVNPATRTTLFLNLADQPFVKNVYQDNIEVDRWLDDPQGAVYSLPITGTTMVIFYNKKIFSDLGINIPATWDELVSACEKIKASGVNPFLFGGKDQWPVNMIFNAMAAPLVSAANPDFFKTLNTGVTKFTDPEFLSVMQRLNTLFQKYFDKNSLGIAYSDAPGLFVQGKCAMLIDGNWTIAQIDQAKPAFDVGVFPTPVSDNADNSKIMIARNGYGWSIIHSTQNRDAALKWMDFIFRPENQKKACDVGGQIPAGPGFQVSNPVNDEIAGLLSNAPKKCQMPEESLPKYTPGAVFSYTAYVISMFGGSLTPEQVVQKLQADFEGSKANWKLPVAAQ